MEFVSIWGSTGGGVKFKYVHWDSLHNRFGLAKAEFHPSDH